MPELPSGYVFISYSRRDDIAMRRIVTFLRQQGIKVWVDNEKLIPGTPVWEIEIEKAIKNAPAIVVLLSPDSKNSEWVRREIGLADQHRKRVFPVLVSGDEETSITLRLINRQFVDIRKDEEAGLNAVSVSLLRYLEELELQEQNAKKEASRLAAQKTRSEKRLAKQRADEERIAHEKNAGQVFDPTDENENRLAAQKVEEERIAREKAETEHKAKVEADRLVAQKVEDERIAREKAEAERKAKIEVERLAAQKAEEERVAREKEETERKAKIEADRFATQKAEDERIAREKAEAERKAKVEVERLAAQKAEEERIAREKEDFKRKNAEIYNRSREAAAKATQALLSKLKIPALVLVIGVVGYFLWQGISSLIPVAPDATNTPTATMTLAPTKTKTPTPTKILTPTPTLEPEPGATMTGKKGETLVYVPKSEFTMGSKDFSDAPVHNVYLDAFWIDQFEVTNEMYAKCVADNSTCAEPSNTNHFSNASYANHPVVYVDWEMAKTYCNWAGGDLPTEAQWEKAARGADERTYPWGNDAPSKDLLNYNGDVGDTTPVGSYESGKSPYNAYDMAGNVWEWVNDWYDVYPDGNKSASTDFGQTYRVLRGGAWGSYDNGVRSAYRFWHFPSLTYNSIGFRCSRSLPVP
jgi:formylglycine-generating enzyme required for sulfatase activity